MKKALMMIFVLTMIVSFAGQSWAFGSKHKGGGGSNNNYHPGSQNSYPNNGGPSGNQNWTDEVWNGPNNSGDPNDPKEDPKEEGNNNFFVWHQDDNQNSQNNQFNKECDLPSSGNNPTVVPEPITLSLMGLGLGGMLLKRRKR